MSTTVVARRSKRIVEVRQVSVEKESIAPPVEEDDFQPAVKKKKANEIKRTKVKRQKTEQETKVQVEAKEEKKEQPATPELSDDDFQPAPKKRAENKGKGKSKAPKSLVEEVEDSKYAQEYSTLPKNTKEDMKIGGHLSIAEGIEKVPAYATSIGARAFAIFTGSQRTWTRKLPSADACKAFKEACTKHKFLPKHILPHGSYLINLGSPEEDKLAKSRELFLLEMQSCEMLGLSLYNFHPGSHRSMISEDACLTKIAESINIVHAKVKGVAAVLEITAGAGDQVGHLFEHLKKIIDQVTDKTRVGVCLDTCHMFASGYDISTEKGYKSVMAKFDEIVGLKYLKGMHINDSKMGLGSKADRHENIGKGLLGKACFERIVNDPHLKDIPMILETAGPYDTEVKLLYNMIK